jgi:6-phosphogluconolactonase (cycloisomerase 2 family)
VANQGSDTVVPFSIAADGQLQQTGEVTAVGAPVCVLFR